MDIRDIRDISDISDISDERDGWDEKDRGAAVVCSVPSHFSLTMFRIQIPDLTRAIATTNLLKSAAREMK